MPQVTVDGAGTFDVEPGTRLVRALSEHDIDISHRCGGHASCTTCRVSFDAGEPDVMTKAEYEKLDSINQLDGFRLACQIVVDRDMTVTPLMRVQDQNWNDPGSEVAVTVEPEPEWHAVEALASDDADGDAEDDGDA